MNTPGTLLSLVWNPKTPLEQAEMIQKIAEEGVNNTPFSDDWKITAAASERRVDVQQWHVDDYETVTDMSMQGRLARRIKSGFRSKIKPESMLNGVTPVHYMWWPKRFEEGLALLTNDKMFDPEWSFLKRQIRDRAPYVCPVGTWSRNQLVESGEWKEPEIFVPSPASRDLSLPRGFSEMYGERLVKTAVPAFADFDVITQRQAWELVFSLTEDEVLTTDTVDEIVDTALAVFD